MASLRRKKKYIYNKYDSMTDKLYKFTSIISAWWCYMLSVETLHFLIRWSGSMRHGDCWLHQRLGLHGWKIVRELGCIHEKSRKTKKKHINSQSIKKVTLAVGGSNDFLEFLWVTRCKKQQHTTGHLPSSAFSEAVLVCRIRLWESGTFHQCSELVPQCCWICGWNGCHKN